MDYKDLIKDYKGEYKHEPFDWGEPVGRERFWENESLNSENVENDTSTN